MWIEAWVIRRSLKSWEAQRIANLEISKAKNGGEDRKMVGDGSVCVQNGGWIGTKMKVKFWALGQKIGSFICEFELGFWKRTCIILHDLPNRC